MGEEGRCGRCGLIQRRNSRHRVAVREAFQWFRIRYRSETRLPLERVASLNMPSISAWNRPLFELLLDALDGFAIEHRFAFSFGKLRFQICCVSDLHSAWQRSY